MVLVVTRTGHRWQPGVSPIPVVVDNVKCVRKTMTRKVGVRKAHYHIAVEVQCIDGVWVEPDEARIWKCIDLQGVNPFYSV